MSRKYQKKAADVLKITRQRIRILFREAKEVFATDPSLANRYIEMARKLGMKYKVKITPSLQKQFCKHCYKYLMPSVNLRVRIKDGHMVYYCLECKCSSCI